MAVSVSSLSYKKLSQAIFEWQAAERISLLALFVLIEVSLHWLWCFFVWLRRDVYAPYVDLDLLYPLWLGVSVVGVFFLWIVSRFSPLKNNTHLYLWQGILVTVYSVYIAVVIMVLGHSSLVAGVSLVGGAMLGMMLVRRRYVWRAFLGHAALILVVSFIPYFGITLPNLRHITLSAVPLDTFSYLNYSEMTTIENALSASIVKNGTVSWDALTQLRQSSAFFWRSTHLYMALPKAFFIIYMFRTLLLILDDSKEEILKYANQDELTQLKSRRCGLTQMEQALMAAESHQDFSVILLDLDWFKAVNDSYGHEIGDIVLFEVAQTIVKSLTDDIIVSRHGGEEFLVVLPNTEHRRAMSIAEQLRQDIACQVIKVADNKGFTVTASLGVYTLTHDERARIKQEYKALLQTEAASKEVSASPDKTRHKHAIKQSHNAQLPPDICRRLICTADKALYAAKGHGRNQVVSANKMQRAKNNEALPVDASASVSQLGA